MPIATHLHGPHMQPTRPPRHARPCTRDRERRTAKPDACRRRTTHVGNADDCKIPYTIDPSGEKIYKRHCFQ